MPRMLAASRCECKLSTALNGQPRNFAAAARVAGRAGRAGRGRVAFSHWPPLIRPRVAAAGRRWPPLADRRRPPPKNAISPTAFFSLDEEYRSVGVSKRI